MLGGSLSPPCRACGSLATGSVLPTSWRLPPNKNKVQHHTTPLNNSHQRRFVVNTKKFPIRVGKYDEVPTYPPRPSFKDFKNVLRPDSRVVVFDGCPDDPYRPASTPLYQTATFRAPSAESFGEYDYTRSGNPTRTALEKQVAMLDGATASFAFTSGMAALAQVVKLAAPGGEVLCGDDIYGGMYRYLTRIAPISGNIRTRFLPTYDLDAVKQALETAPPGDIRLLHLETPSNPLLRITDIEAAASICHDHGVLLSVDATAMGPLLCRPIDLGADLVVHSATKWISGHADTMGGLLSVKDTVLANEIAYQANAEGTALAPFDCWLLLRGIKTLAIRQQRSMKNARKVAQFLSGHPKVMKMYWTEAVGAGGGAGSGRADGVPVDHEGDDFDPDEDDSCVLQLSHIEEQIHAKQASGPGCLISFETGDAAFSKRFLDACRIFKISVSFGSVHSVCEMPVNMSHASLPQEKTNYLAVEPLAEDLVRLSIGIEDVDDLIEDLRQAFEAAEALTENNVKEFYQGPRLPSRLVRENLPGLFTETDPKENLLFDSKFEDLEVIPAPSDRGESTGGEGAELKSKSESEFDSKTSDANKNE